MLGDTRESRMTTSALEMLSELLIELPVTSRSVTPDSLTPLEVRSMYALLIDQKPEKGVISCNCDKWAISPLMISSLYAVLIDQWTGRRRSLPPGCH
jgi:hypothetical protein